MQLIRSFWPGMKAFCLKADILKDTYSSCRWNELRVINGTVVRRVRHKAECTCTLVDTWGVGVFYVDACGVILPPTTSYFSRSNMPVYSEEQTKKNNSVRAPTVVSDYF